MTPPDARPDRVAPLRFVPFTTALVMDAFVRFAFDMFEFDRLAPTRITWEKFTPLKFRPVIVAPDRFEPGPTRNPPSINVQLAGSVGLEPETVIPDEVTPLSVEFVKFVAVIVAPVKLAPAC